MNNHIEFHNGGDANVTITDTGGEIALKIFQVIANLIILVITSPLWVTMLISESRKDSLNDG